jgi:hypothetical protein
VTPASNNFQEEAMGKSRRFAGAVVIAGMMSVALLGTPKPAAADDISLCAVLEAAKINIQNTHAPGWAKDAAIAAVTAAQVAAGCIVG